MKNHDKYFNLSQAPVFKIKHVLSKHATDFRLKNSYIFLVEKNVVGLSCSTTLHYRPFL